MDIPPKDQDTHEEHPLRHDDQVPEKHQEHMPLHEQTQEQTDEDEDYHSLRTLISWHAPGRPYREKGKEFYVNALLITLFLEVILLLFREYLLMGVLASLVFLAYALSVVPPRSLFYKISTEGIMVEDHFYLWQELYDFYFKQKDGHTLLHIRTKWFVPGELIMVLGEVPKDQIQAILLQYLPYREYVKPSFTEKSSDWLEKTFPLERRSQ